MFGKKKNTDGKKNYDLTYENLAIPEIHTHEAEEPVDKEQKETDLKPEVVYDSVAIPEVHIRKKKWKKRKESEIKSVIEYVNERHKIYIG